MRQRSNSRWFFTINIQLDEIPVPQHLTQALYSDIPYLYNYLFFFTFNFFIPFLGKLMLPRIY